MATMTITVASIEWPKDGKKTGCIVDTTGKRWYVYADKVGTYQQFASYDITIKTSEFKGSTYYYIETATQVAGNPRSSTTPVPPSTRPVSPTPSRADYDDNQRRLDIFVCGAFNNIMSNANIDPKTMSTDNMILMISALKAAWKRTLGPEAQPTLARGALDGELDDLIPF